MIYILESKKDLAGFMELIGSKDKFNGKFNYPVFMIAERANGEEVMLVFFDVSRAMRKTIKLMHEDVDRDKLK